VEESYSSNFVPAVLMVIQCSVSISESLANPTLELIAVGNLLPRMSFDTEKSPDPPYIYRALIYIEGRGELFNKNVGPPLGF
jgi:hypothetical protein